MFVQDIISLKEYDGVYELAEEMDKRHKMEGGLALKLLSENEEYSVISGKVIIFPFGVWLDSPNNMLSNMIT